MTWLSLYYALISIVFAGVAVYNVPKSSVVETKG